MNAKNSLLLISLIFIQGIAFSQSWIQIADFPATERDDAVSFVVGETAYCGTGLKPFFVASNDMYAFDMNTETWVAINSLPAGTERQYATGFSYNNYGFVFGGIGSNYFNDLWMYDPQTGNWQAKLSLPAEGRMGSGCFVINDTAYVIGGRTSMSNSISEVWAYCISADTWTQKNDLPFGSRWRASTATDNTKGYLIFGVDSESQFRRELYEFNPLINTWSQISVFPGTGRAYAAMNYINDELLVIAGLDSLNNSYNDMWKFDLTEFVWQALDAIPASGRRGGMCFNSSTTVYYSTGIDLANTRLKETWKVNNPNTINEKYWNDKVSIYPNPANGYIEIASCLKNFTVSIYEITGKLITSEKTMQNKTRIELNNTAKGIYIIRLQSEDQQITKKFILQ
jgi:N-acetylneuraminic acid mutarotase